ncbi:MAG: DUF1614 domain-containing protein [Candidatus Methanomethylicia archaeon]|jgi:uncharacterized membrane protein|nr:DUF1614 domain-containing protein [Candidatus Methanomethylicia archaeon]
MRRVFFLPIVGAMLAVFLIVLVFMVPLILFGIIGRTLHRFGLPWYGFLLFLIFSLMGSTVNVPLWKIRTDVPVIIMRYAYFMGIPYPIPSIESKESYTTVSINVGGAIMPLILSSYLLMVNSAAIPASFFAILSISMLTYFLSRPVQGLGIVVPGFIPPILTAIVALLVGGEYAPVVAYVGGTVGTLLGADLFHKGDFKKLGASNVSIGGAGTFDGIFLTGLIALLLAS